MPANYHKKNYFTAKEMWQAIEDNYNDLKALGRIRTNMIRNETIATEDSHRIFRALSSCKRRLHDKAWAESTDPAKTLVELYT